MKMNFLRAAALSALLSTSAVGLAACDATGLSAQIESTLTSVLNVTKTVCNVVPDVGPVISLINGAAGATAEAIGTSICAALGKITVSGRLRATLNSGTALTVDSRAHTVNGILITAP